MKKLLLLAILIVGCSKDEPQPSKLCLYELIPYYDGRRAIWTFQECITLDQVKDYQDEKYWIKGCDECR